jgi:hypothetical protein
LLQFGTDEALLLSALIRPRLCLLEWWRSKETQPGQPHTVTPSFTNEHHLGLGLMGTVWEDALVRIVEVGDNGLLIVTNTLHLVAQLSGSEQVSAFSSAGIGSEVARKWDVPLRAEENIDSKGKRLKHGRSF